MKNPIDLIFETQYKLNNKSYLWGLKNKKKIRKNLNIFLAITQLIFNVVSVMYLLYYMFITIVYDLNIFVLLICANIFFILADLIINFKISEVL